MSDLVDSIRDLEKQVSEMQFEVDSLEGEVEFYRGRTYALDDEVYSASDRAERMEALALALLKNLNGDLVKVWREHETTLKELGYSA